MTIFPLPSPLQASFSHPFSTHTLLACSTTSHLSCSTHCSGRTPFTCLSRSLNNCPNPPPTSTTATAASPGMPLPFLPRACPCALFQTASASAPTHPKSYAAPGPASGTSPPTISRAFMLRANVSAYAGNSALTSHGASAGWPHAKLKGVMTLAA
ncbi:hypothetical protein VTK26DRAFT_8310 [Humicola hyalothermophila]